MKTKQALMLSLILLFILSIVLNAQIKSKIEHVAGKAVKTLINEQKEMGKYTVQFDASFLASGMYVYQLRVNDYTSTKKMLLLK